MSRPGGGQADLSVGVGLIIDEYGLGSMPYFMSVRNLLPKFTIVLFSEQKRFAEGIRNE